MKGRLLIQVTRSKRAKDEGHERRDGTASACFIGGEGASDGQLTPSQAGLHRIGRERRTPPSSTRPEAARDTTPPSGKAQARQAPPEVLLAKVLDLKHGRFPFRTAACADPSGLSAIVVARAESSERRTSQSGPLRIRRRSHALTCRRALATS